MVRDRRGVVWWRRGEGGARDGDLRDGRFLQTGDVGVDGRVRGERAGVLERGRETELGT